MRGTDTQQSGMFSYVSPEERVPERDPLRAIRRMTDEVLQGLSAKFNELYSAGGRPSIAPEKLLRALWLQILYTVRSERLLMEQLQCNVLIEHRNGLVVDAELLQANGTAERDAALLMAERIAGSRRVTVAADKGYDTKEFVREIRGMNVTPHVAQNDKRPGGSAIDKRTTRHAGYKVSQVRRKRVEEVFGWLKTVGMLRKTRHRGVLKVAWVFTFRS